MIALLDSLDKKPLCVPCQRLFVENHMWSPLLNDCVVLMLPQKIPMATAKGILVTILATTFE
jgi:hypothetical protein